LLDVTDEFDESYVTILIVIYGDGHLRAGHERARGGGDELAIPVEKGIEPGRPPQVKRMVLVPLRFRTC
jgi:hypothetical protein